MSAPWHVAVLIPARNEEELLPRCLTSVLLACSFLPPLVTCDVVVAIDSSTDGTWQIAERMLRGAGTVVRTDAGVVGQARALAAEAALQRSRVPLHRCWLANTDADCIVPKTWLHDQLSLATKGLVALAGIIDVDTFEEHDAEVPARFRKTYVIPQNGIHSHVHGANLGVRADAYLRAGGWKYQATAEDHDLWKRLGHANSKRQSTGRLRVITSGRRVGRAPHGFAEALSAHNGSTG